MAESNWYLEVNGKKVGPFNLEHIQGLYDDGEIKGYHQVTSDQLDGQWISVQELVDSLTLSAPPAPPTEEPPSERRAESHEPELEPDVTSQIEMPVLEDPDSPPSFPSSAESEKTSEAAYVNAPEAPAPPHDFNAGFQPPPRPSGDKTNTALQSAALRAKESPAAVTETASALPVLESASDAQATVIEESSYTSPDSPTSLPPIVATLAQTTPNNDPALSMLSSLQLFKERQQNNHREPAYNPALVIHSDTVGRGSTIPLRMWLTAIFAGMVLGCLSWGVIRVLKSKPASPAGTMVQQTTLPKTPPPPVTSTQSQSTTASGSSAFKAAEPPKESIRRAPPRPLIAPVSAPAPVRAQPEEPRRDEQQEQEQPPQPQYAPQYQQYPQTGDQIPNNQNPQAPVPAQNVNGQNIYPSEQMPPAYPNGGAVPGADQMAPPQQQPPPGTMGGYPQNPNVQQGVDLNYNNGQNNGGVDPNQPQQNPYNNGGGEQQNPQQQPPPPQQQYPSQ